MKRLALIVATVVLASTPALACKCALVPYDKVVEQTPVVFDGEVVRSEPDMSGEWQVTSFRVRGAVKGVSQRAVLRFDSVLRRMPQRTITVLSRVKSAQCGWDFTESPSRLIVGATRNADGNLVASRCTMYNLNRRP
jgi:hypothetical protein